MGLSNVLSLASYRRALHMFYLISSCTLRNSLGCAKTMDPSNEYFYLFEECEHREFFYDFAFETKKNYFGKTLVLFSMCKSPQTLTTENACIFLMHHSVHVYFVEIIVHYFLIAQSFL